MKKDKVNFFEDPTVKIDNTLIFQFSKINNFPVTLILYITGSTLRK